MTQNGLGKNVLITGANRGLGFGMVQEIAKNYSVKRIFAACRDPEKAKDLQSLKSKYPSIVPIKLDVQNDKTVDSALEEVKKILGGENLNVLINNAAILEDNFADKTGGSFVQPNRDYFTRHFDVNLNGLVIVTGKFLPLIKKAASDGERALVVNISSSLGSIELGMAADFYTKNGDVAYSLTKAAVNHYTHLVAKFLKNEKVVTVAFCPGWVKTDMGSEAAELTIEQSISPLIKTISGLKQEQNGNYLNRFGETIPW